MKHHIPSLQIARARELRRNATPAEIALWRLLREDFPEARWRRQVPLLDYIADFASHRWRIVIEVDGGQHSPDADALRTRRIEAEGYRVVRFWNAEVLENPAGCYERLRLLLSPPSSSG